MAILYVAAIHIRIWTLRFSHKISIDRPPFYGIFIGFTSGLTTLWGPIFFQCLLLSWLLQKYSTLFGAQRMRMSFKLAWIATVVSLTGVSWVCSYLVPDIFTAILLLAILLYLLDNNADKRLKVVYMLIITFSVIVHNSHLLLIIFICLFYFSWVEFLIKNKERVRKKPAAVCDSDSFLFFNVRTKRQGSLGFCFFHLPHKYSLPPSLLQMVFSINILKIIAARKKLILCDYKGMIPAETYNFMWPDKIHAFVETWIVGRISCTKEFRHLNRDIFTTPKYLGMYLKDAGISTVQQLFEVTFEKPFAFQKDD